MIGEDSDLVEKHPDETTEAQVAKLESLEMDAAEKLKRVVGVLREHDMRMTGMDARLKAAETELARLKAGAWRLVGVGAVAGLLLGSCAVDRHYSGKLDRAERMARDADARSRDAESRSRGSTAFARDAEDVARWADDDAAAARERAREADERAEAAIDACERMARDHGESISRCS